MKYIRLLTITAVVLISLFILSAVSGCGKEPEATPSPTPTLPPPPPPSTIPPTPEPVNLAPYNGRIEHIYLHEVIAWPEPAFTGSRSELLNNEYITANEFWKILKELHKNNYVLINLNDVYSEYMDETGRYRLRQNTLEVPEGKKPLVISFDNLNFNEALIPHGFMSRYIIGIDGQIWAEGTDPDGNRVTSQDLTAITLLDKFVDENPDFSLGGVKGCLSLTGAQGILGYRTGLPDEGELTGDARLKRMHEIAMVKPVIEKLHETGWYFASHTYGRISLGNARLDTIQADAERWFDEVGSLVGETSLLTYPAGSRLDGDDTKTPGPAFQYYVSIGFRYFAATGTQHYVKIKSDDYLITAVIQDRAFMCGTRFRTSRDPLMRFFDVKDIYDPKRPDYDAVIDS